MQILTILIKGLCLFFITFCSAFIFRFGKRSTGIVSDYVVTVIFLIICLWRLG